MLVRVLARDIFSLVDPNIRVFFTTRPFFAEDASLVQQEKKLGPKKIASICLPRLRATVARGPDALFGIRQSLQLFREWCEN